MTDSPRCIAYLRCSLQEQSTEGNSIETQRSKIEAWALATSSEITEWIIDAGVSGSKALASRPGGARIAALLDSRKQSHIEAVVCSSLDRLGRDAAESLMLFKKFRTGSVGLVSVRERIDLASPQGRAFAQMASVFSELERAMTAERTRDNLREIRRQGRVFGVVPFGYRAEDGRLVRDENEQAVLRRIRQMRKSGISFDRCAKKLNGDGVPSKRGGQWYAMSVRNSLAASDKMLTVSA